MSKSHCFSVFVFICIAGAALASSDEDLLHAVVHDDFIPDNVTKSEASEEGDALLEVLGGDDVEDNQDTPASTESSPLFNEIDLDQNGVLSKEEFTLHYNNIAGTATSSSSKSETGNEASALNPSMLDDVALAWHEFDSNVDGSVSISEWNAIMFHEEPQAPQYEDGYDMSVQDDQAHRRIIFRDWDADKSGLLNKTELHAMMGGSDEDKSAMIQQEREMVIFQLMEDHDKDGDGHLSLEEFVHGEHY